MSLRNYYRYHTPGWAADFGYILHPEGMADLVDHEMVVDTSTKPSCQNPLVDEPVVSLNNFD